MRMRAAASFALLAALCASPALAEKSSFKIMTPSLEMTGLAVTSSRRPMEITTGTLEMTGMAVTASRRPMEITTGTLEMTGLAVTASRRPMDITTGTLEMTGMAVTASRRPMDIQTGALEMTGMAVVGHGQKQGTKSSHGPDDGSDGGARMFFDAGIKAPSEIADDPGAERRAEFYEDPGEPAIDPHPQGPGKGEPHSSKGQAADSFELQ